MFKHSLIALAAMGAGLVGLSGSAAQAFPAPSPVTQTDQASSLVVDVKHGRRGKHWDYYSPKHHGDRCSRRSRHCRHYHGGYWYENPWWVLPFVGAGIALGSRDRYYDYDYGSAHVEWCLDRYRSYNVRTNTWVSYSGRVHQCISPYGP